VGCLVGGGFWALWLVALFGLYEADARSLGVLSSYWFVLWFVVAAALCLIAIDMTTRRSTRRFGQSMLRAPATLLLVGSALVVLQDAFTPS
jgi:hypothetical protein